MDISQATAQFKARLTAQAGGMHSRQDVAELLEIAPAAVNHKRQCGELLGVPDGSEFRFPVAQFKNGATIEGLEAVLAGFGDMDPWGQLQLLVAPLEGFSEEPATMLDLLSSDIDEAMRDQLVRLAKSWTR